MNVEYAERLQIMLKCLSIFISFLPMLLCWHFFCLFRVICTIECTFFFFWLKEMQKIESERKREWDRIYVHYYTNFLLFVDRNDSREARFYYIHLMFFLILGFIVMCISTINRSNRLLHNRVQQQQQQLKEKNNHTPITIIIKMIIIDFSV